MAAVSDASENREERGKKERERERRGIGFTIHRCQRGMHYT
jgi:hypothetical protein